MAWSVLPARDAFVEFAAEWDRLNSSLYARHPMFDSRFLGPQLACFGSGQEWLCVHRTAATVDGALILTPRGMGRWMLFLPPQAQAGAVMLADALLLETLFAALPGVAWSIDLLALDPSFEPAWNGRLPRTVTRHALTIAVDLVGSFDEYWCSRPHQLRKNLRRYILRTGTRTSDRSVTVITDPQLTSAAVQRYGALEARGWKGQAGTAVSPENGQEQFYSTCLTNFARSGQGRIMELRLGDCIAASRLIVSNEQTWIILKTTYDEALAAEAPGRQLLFEVLQRAFAELPRTGKVEFYTRATRDQMAWATSKRYICHSQVFRFEAAVPLRRYLHRIHGWLPSGSSTEKPVDGDVHQSVDVQAYSHVEDLPCAAAKLFEGPATRNPENSLAWFANLHRAVFAMDPGVRYYQAQLGDTPVAVLPVRLVRRGIVRQVESLSNYYTSLYSPILTPTATPADLADLLATASREHGRAHVMRFWPMDPESSGYEALLAALRSAGWLPFRYFCFGNWFLDVSTSWQDYLRARDGQLRNTIRRMERKFVAAGGTFDIVTGSADVEDAIQAFNAVYALSWKKPEPYPEFVPGLVRWLAREGQLRLGIARLRGQPVAAQIWMVGHGRAGIFKLAYDEAYAAYSPGTLLTAHLLEHAIDRDHVSEVDYLIGDDRHKERWMNHRRERWGIVAYNPRTLTGLVLLLREILGRTMRQITRSASPSAKTGQDHMNWIILPIQDFDQHAAQWDALVRRVRGVAFLESSFLRPLLDEFGTGKELLVLGHQGDELQAGAIVSRLRPAVWQTFQPSQLPLGAWISTADLDLREAATSLIRALPGTAISLGMTQLDPLLNRRPEDTRDLMGMDYIDTAWVDIDQTFDAYWEARGKNLKSNTRKQHSKLQAEGTRVSLECLREPDRVAAAIDAYGRLESSGWKGKDGTAVHPDNAQGRFYRRMMENFCAQGRGRIYQYRFNDQVVAMDLCIEADDKLVILKTAYDESYKSTSPSTLMRHEEFRNLFGDPVLKRIEFYGKVMEWHSRWTDRSRRLYHLTSYRSPLFGLLHSAYKNVRQRPRRDPPAP